MVNDLVCIFLDFSLYIQSYIGQCIYICNICLCIYMVYTYKVHGIFIKNGNVAIIHNILRYFCLCKTYCRNLSLLVCINFFLSFLSVLQQFLHIQGPQYSDSISFSWPFQFFPSLNTAVADIMGILIGAPVQVFWEIIFVEVKLQGKL